jgi:hypothetical protein
LRMKSKISFCLLVRSRSTISLSVVPSYSPPNTFEHLFAGYRLHRMLARSAARCRPEHLESTALAAVAELVDAQG